VSAMTAAQVRHALKKRFPAPECGIVFEVAQGTGSHARRHLDAIAMELWPSRGLALNGIEIKVNLYDWRREKANPAKAEEIARFCDFFWIAAPKGVIPLEELPSAWGLLEVQEDGTVRQGKAAAKQEAQPVTKMFLAAMMRAAGRAPETEEIEAVIQERTKALEADFKVRLDNELKFRSDSNEADGKQWRELLAALGEEGGYFYRNAELVAAVKMVMQAGAVRTYGGIRALHKEIAEAAERIGKALGDIPDVVEEAPQAFPTRRARR
jgi:hypothetical protein